MNVREGDRLAAIAILEPSANGNGGDEGEGAAASAEEAEVAAAMLPSEAGSLEGEAGPRITWIRPDGTPFEPRVRVTLDTS